MPQIQFLHIPGKFFLPAMSSTPIPGPGSAFRRSPSFKIFTASTDRPGKVLTPSRFYVQRRRYSFVTLSVVVSMFLLLILILSPLGSTAIPFFSSMLTSPRVKTAPESPPSNSTSARSQTVLSSILTMAGKFLSDRKQWRPTYSSHHNVSVQAPGPSKVGKAAKKQRKKAGPLLEIEADDPGLVGRMNDKGEDTCHPDNAALRLYMYDLDPGFHFGILHPDYVKRWPRNVSDIPRYRGGMTLQHSPEYWLTIDLLTSTFPDRNWPCVAVRVMDPAQADLFFVPFFSSIAYNVFTVESYKRKPIHDTKVDDNVLLQTRLMSFLLSQPYWNRTGGRDHIVTVHHPNSMHIVREQVSECLLILADFGRYKSDTANVFKDFIAPYKHVVPTYVDDECTFQCRTTLLYFQGMIVRKEGGIIRQRLYESIKDEEGVHFRTGNTRSEGIRSATSGMRLSKYCLHLAGDTPSSNRLFDAIASHCVPVIISDDLELPFEDWLDYSEFSIFVKGSDSIVPGFLMALLRGISEEKWLQMWRRLKEVDQFFEYRYPPQKDDAVPLIWRGIAKKVPSLNLVINKWRRFQLQEGAKRDFVGGNNGTEVNT